MTGLSFWLDVRNPERRRIQVLLEVDVADLSGAGRGWQEFFLPTWTPGSYMIREFARHLGPVLAWNVATGQALGCAKKAKNRFRVDLPAGVRRLRLDYWAYAHDLTVRTADVTPEHAYWNHACVLLWPVDEQHLPATITIRLPPSWDFACSLPEVRRSPGEVVLRAEDFAAANDAPCLAGTLTQMEWAVRGIPHCLVLDGLGPVKPPEELIGDLTRLVECAAEVFGGPLPYARYLFLCLCADSGHGGLEHAESTTLLARRTAFRKGADYRELLGLAAHEHFHAWNIKRMRPQELWSYDYEQENYTAMLWLAEGFTAYYDDLLCRRAGILSVPEYLEIVAKNVTKCWSGVGRLRQSLADASFDAWIRFYRPDENTRNSTQNYYGNGSLAALVIDLAIRKQTQGRKCLDDALRELYRTTFGAGRGYRRDDVARCLAAAAEADLEALLATLIDGPFDPDFATVLADFGVTLVQKDKERPFLGISLETERMRVSYVDEAGPAFAAGIAPDDEILALEGLRVTADRWAEVFEATAAIGRPLRLLTSTRGIIAERTVVPTLSPVGSVSLQLTEEVSPERRLLRDAWLAVKTPADSHGGD